MATNYDPLKALFQSGPIKARNRFAGCKGNVIGTFTAEDGTTHSFAFTADSDDLEMAMLVLSFLQDFNAIKQRI